MHASSRTLSPAAHRFAELLEKYEAAMDDWLAQGVFVEPALDAAFTRLRRWQRDRYPVFGGLVDDIGLQANDMLLAERRDGKRSVPFAGARARHVLALSRLRSVIEQT